jgi:hypothetical protein
VYRGEVQVSIEAVQRLREPAQFPTGVYDVLARFVARARGGGTAQCGMGLLIFATVSLADWAEAMRWIINHQLGRRNLDALQRDILIGRRYEWEKKAHGAQTSPRLTLLVKSKTGGKAILYRMFEGPRDCLHAAGDPRSYGVGNLPLRLNQQSHDFLDACAE